jgi:hypothetical protein
MADNDLDVLDPSGRNVTVAGRTVSIVPLTVAQFPRFARAIRYIPQVSLVDDSTDWLGLLAEHGDNLIEAAAVATEMESKDLGALPADEFVELCSAILEVNIDFFVQRLAPAIERASVAIVKAIPGAGADTLQALITAGHPPDSIMRYTLAQVRMYIDAIARARKAASRERLLLLRAAGADEKGFNRVWKEIGE